MSLTFLLGLTQSTRYMGIETVNTATAEQIMKTQSTRYMGIETPKNSEKALSSLDTIYSLYGYKKSRLPYEDGIFFINSSNLLLIM